MNTKTKEVRLKELQVAVDSIRFSLQQFLQMGEEMHMLNVKSQLRALIASGGRSYKPLLFELSNVYKVPLFIYSIPEVEMPPPADLLIDAVISPSWVVRANNDVVRFLFRDWLDQPAYFHQTSGEYKSRNYILRELADKTAAHYDEDVGLMYEYLGTFTYSPVISTKGVRIPISAVHMFLFDVATATCYLSYTLIHKARSDYHQIEDLKNTYESYIRPFSIYPYRISAKGKKVNS